MNLYPHDCSYMNTEYGKRKSQECYDIEMEEPAAAMPDPEPAEMAPAPCPDNPETTYTWEYCNACKKFVGCPAWG